MRDIAILIHKRGELHKTNYFMRGLLQVWTERGLRVQVLQGPTPDVKADIAILHVDLTVVPQDHLNFVRQFPIAINADVADISKRHISSSIVHRGDGYQGPVIIKTNRNFGGMKEREMLQKSPLTRVFGAVRHRLPWAMRADLSVWDYPILDSVDLVPLAAWFNPDLIVERFRPERRDGYYCLRTWFFFGDQETNRLMYAPVPIIKSKFAVRIEDVPVPDELREIRRRMGFDFGKFDYAMIDGRVVLYDVNRTPVMGDPTKIDYSALLNRMADGLDSICRQQLATPPATDAPHPRRPVSGSRRSSAA